MARLYCANCTGQNFVVYTRVDYSVDENGNRAGDQRSLPPRMQEIPARAQIQFGGELYPTQMTEIIKQLEETFGAVHADAIRTAKARGHVKMVWQQDKPITAAVMKDVYEHNVGYLSEDGVKRRKTLALVADRTMADITGAIPDVKQSAVIEVEFEADEDEDPDAPGLVGEGYRVPRSTTPVTKSRSRGRRAA